MIRQIPHMDQVGTQLPASTTGAPCEEVSSSDFQSWQRLQELFKAARRLDPQQREAFIAEACGDDRELKQQLEEMLAADKPAEKVLGDSIVGKALRSAALAELAPNVPEQIGRYRITGVIASGGMGTVYEAQQQQPRRTVALKVMRWSIASPSALRRFEYESEILARLRHPGIARVFEAGTQQDGTEAVPYFAMEYIPEAKPITAYAEAENLPLRQRLELLTRVCDAAEYGHQQGIIHRDLKPSNILVDGDGEPSLIDFGVARSTGENGAAPTQHTASGELIGTLQYMSPEQCAGDSHEVDTRTDVYSLGVVLYELLCGKLPYDVTSLALGEATRVVREAAPARLSTINPALRGDVETIVQKALEKEKDRRYRSPAELADDIRRYLSGQAILARPPSAVYQLRMLAGRHKILLAGVAAVVLSLVLGIIGTSIGFVRADRQRTAADLARGKAEQSEAKATQEAEAAKRSADLMTDMIGSAIARSADEPTTIESMLDRMTRKIENGTFADDAAMEYKVRRILGIAYWDMGRLDAAEQHLRAVFEFKRRELGDEHRGTIGNAANLILVLVFQKNLDEAERLARHNLEVARRRLDDRRRPVPVHLFKLGWVLHVQGKLDEAEPLYREGLARFRKAFNNKGKFVASASETLSTLLVEKGELDEAETLLREALVTFRNANLERTTGSGVTRGVLGRCLTRMKRYEEAEPELLAAEGIVLAASSERHHKYQRIIGQLVELYDAWDKPEEAARWRAKLIEKDSK